MKHSSHLVALVAVLSALAFATGGFAQDRYDDRNGDGDADGNGRFAFAVGAGVVEPDGGGEIYYHSALRIRVSKDDQQRRGKDDWRYASRGDIQAHIEPEIGYWSRDDRGLSESDLSVGVNAVGVVPGRAVDYSFGVGLGAHFLDTKIQAVGGGVVVNESDAHFGGNFQVGLDVHVSPSVSLFGTGRFDVIEGLDETLQGKVYMGLRFRF
jgi:hypothetical protein